MGQRLRPLTLNHLTLNHQPSITFPFEFLAIPRADPLIDLRSDTVTKPTPGMRQAMASAEVGDDVIDIDPTTRRLEELTAERLGKEAALFMPSGTMTNQVGIRLHCQPGDEFLCEQEAHVYLYEQGAFAQLSQLVAHTIPGDFGILDVEQLRPCIRMENDHSVRTRLVCLENTHNRGSGRIFPLEKISAICDWAHENSLKTHLDGARLWNAVVATGISESVWASGFDSVSVCFSKGLGAPVGSCLAGSAEFIRRAKRARKLFGGGMRQSGILAAAALYAIEHHYDRLCEDHVHAKLLADTIRGCDGLTLLPDQIDTNIVIFRLDSRLGTAANFLVQLRAREIIAMATGPQNVRLVTHLDVSRDQILRACEAIKSIVQSLCQFAS